MSVLFHIPGYLRAFTEGRSRVDLDGSPSTVRDALAALGAIHPGVLDRVLNEQGAVRTHVNVFVGAENIRDLGGLGAAVPEGAEISIVPAVSGG